MRYSVNLASRDIAREIWCIIVPVRPNTNRAWPYGFIPYENNRAAREVQAHIDQFNQSVGIQLFQPRGTEANYVKFTTLGHGSSPIGYQDVPNQMITVKGRDDPRTTLHEMGHAAGLGHEHFHSQFPIRNAAVRNE